MFIDLKDAIKKYDSLPEGEQKKTLNVVINKAIVKATGLSGQTAQEWRQEFKDGKKLTWGDIREPKDVPEFNIFNEEVFEEACVWDEKLDELENYLKENFGEKEALNELKIK